MRGKKNAKSSVDGLNHCRVAVITCLGPSNCNLFHEISTRGLLWTREPKMKKLWFRTETLRIATIGCPTLCF